MFTGIETAELTKYAANAFLAMKVTFINEMADLCEKVGADVHDVARGIGLDGRIGRKFLHPGPGYGGSCFPKDTLALVRTAQDYGAPSRLVETTVAVNDARKSSMAMRVIAACGGSVRGKTIAVLGLTFKPETDDMRDAPSLSDRRAAGRRRRHDPRLRPRGHGAGANRCCPRASTYCRDAFDAAQRRRCAGADHRMERIPRAQPDTAARDDARTRAGGSAQRLRPGGDAAGRLRLPLRWTPRSCAPGVILSQRQALDWAAWTSPSASARMTGPAMCAIASRDCGGRRSAMSSSTSWSSTAPRRATFRRRLEQLVRGSAMRDCCVSSSRASVWRAMPARRRRLATTSPTSTTTRSRRPTGSSASCSAIGETDPPPALIGGRILPHWEAPLPSWWPPSLRGSLSIIELEGQGEYRTAALPRGLEPYGANMVIHVPSLRAIGGFGTQSGRIGEALLSDEEVQLAWRLQDAGHSARYDSRIVVRHQIQAARLTPAWLLSRLYWQGVSTVRTRRLLGRPGEVWRELPRRIVVAALLAPSALLPRHSTHLVPYRWRLAYALGFIRAALGWGATGSPMRSAG